MALLLVGCVLRPFDSEVIHLEMGPPFTIPCEGREARESNPGPSRDSPLHSCWATPAPGTFVMS